MKETKKAVSKVSAKAEPVKAAVKTEAAKVESAVKSATEKAAPVVKAATAKAETAKKTVKATAKKAVAKTTAVKKTAPEQKISVQFSGKSYTTEELVKISKDVWKYDLNGKEADFKTVELFVKPEESTVYYVINGDVRGSFAI